MGRITVKEAYREIADRRAALGPDREFKITVDRGLYLRCAPSGVTTWHCRYVVHSNQRQIRLPAPFGIGPGFMSLAEAVSENARIQALARDGIDIQVQKQERLDEQKRLTEQKRIQDLTVKDLFEAWIADGVSRKDGNANISRAFSKDVLPSIGAIAIKEVTEHHLRGLYRNIVSRGAERTAVVVANDVRQMFRWAEKRQPWRGLLIDGNPTDLVDVKKLLSHDYCEERSRVLSSSEIRELHETLLTMKETYLQATVKYDYERPLAEHTQCALWISLGTLCRIGELLMAQWQHIDLENGIWFIPQENTKAQRGKKQDHTVFLNEFSLSKFKRLKVLSEGSDWVFPAKNCDGHLSVKTVTKQIGDRQMAFKQRKELAKRVNSNSLVLSNGERGEWTPHDLRRTGATMMQGLGVPIEIIDRCQNHVLAGSRVRRHYLHYDYAKEKREAWEKLGQAIESIILSNNIYLMRA